MRKQVFIGFFLLTVVFYAFAGDAAVFVDEGFSEDGSVYIFGQYGKTDRTFEAYAELYTVDVEKNKYVPGKVFKILPSRATVNKGGKELYEQLVSKNYVHLQKYSRNKVNPDNLLYICGDDVKTNPDKIVFTDFTVSTISDPVSYHVQLISCISGTGMKSQSSFYISVMKQNSSGAVVGTYQIGSPDIKRKGISAYKINRIFRDKSGKGLVFIIEETVENNTGTCIRYMVETSKL